METKTFTEGDFKYTVQDGQATLDSYSGSQSILAIPETLRGYSVTSIGDWAFDDCSALSKLTIPSSVTSIGAYAFYCSGVTEVTIPDSVTSIGIKAFRGCSDLNLIISKNHLVYKFVDGVLFDISKNILCAYVGKRDLSSYIIPNSVTSIGDYAFKCCENFTEVTIPNSVTHIGADAFFRCYGLTEVTIPDSVTTIGNRAFEGCINLAKITIPDSVITISYGAFSICHSLTEVTIPNSVTSIGEQAFEDCPNLAKVTISNSVTNIGKQAFEHCPNLTKVPIPDSVTSIGKEAFDNGCHIICNEGSTAHEYALKNKHQFVLPSKDTI